MQRLWAPWREQYITKVITNKHKGCIFCDMFKSKADAKNYIFIRGKLAYAVLNIYPYSNGHLMVAPYRHTGKLDDLTEDELKDLMVLSRRCQNLISHTFKPDGFNIGFNLGSAAGAGIADHLHLHVVPRWNGDTNFMTVISDNRIISEGLKETYEKLSHQLKNA